MYHVVSLKQPQSFFTGFRLNAVLSDDCTSSQVSLGMAKLGMYIYKLLLNFIKQLDVFCVCVCVLVTITA